jgi:hypothetical protein
VPLNRVQLPFSAGTTSKPVGRKDGYLYIGDVPPCTLVIFDIPYEIPDLEPSRYWINKKLLFTDTVASWKKDGFGAAQETSYPDSYLLPDLTERDNSKNYEDGGVMIAVPRKATFPLAVPQKITPAADCGVG